MADATHTRTAPPLLDPGCALFLDVDGTLVDFQVDPAQVRTTPSLREAISRLSRYLGGALALVSGRPLEQLDALFQPLRLPAAGLHGHQLRAGAGGVMAQAHGGAALGAVLDGAARLARAHPGVRVEDKGAALALHWRANPGAQAAVLDFAGEHIHALPGHRLQHGDHVVEFVPAGADKGRALEQLMAQAPFAGRVPVFVGDDLTDEFGFAAAHRAGGWSVLVGNRPGSQARHGLADTRAVLDWLLASLPPSCQAREN